VVVELFSVAASAYDKATGSGAKKQGLSFFPYSLDYLSVIKKDTQKIF